ncbi:hypothetical protein SAMN03159288_02282 [Rhizobium sp. NFACC06-2]|nr:hypothetical protein SAMN03159288_02282 [Rhizobium sp. NFACC06-2]
MSLRMTATGVQKLAEGIWRLDMPPHQVRLLGSPPSAIGERSILLLREGKYESATGTLEFDIGDASALNVGTQQETIVLLSTAEVSLVRREIEKPMDGYSVSMPTGDREFLQLVHSELPDPMQRAAAQLLEGVRKRYPGELKRGLSRNFSETPDNFWYVIVQPRVEELSITVRGTVDHFSRVSKLEIKDDRGNTRFKVRGPDDVEAALELIFHARRR